MADFLRHRSIVLPMKPWSFSCEMEVRDYECDLQGIVNNARYQHYLEHARHLLLKSRGLDFAELSRTGVNLIVYRIELDYKYPLRSGDTFRVDLRFSRLGRIRIAFDQEIRRLSDEKLCLIGKVLTTAIDPDGRPIQPKAVLDRFPETASS